MVKYSLFILYHSTQMSLIRKIIRNIIQNYKIVGVLFLYVIKMLYKFKHFPLTTNIIGFHTAWYLVNKNK